MTVSDLINELQRMPQHLPVRVLVDVFYDADGTVFYLEEGLDDGPVDAVRQSGGYVLIKGG